jgi:phage shock protein PspC (stress-responsive transcriptional regulator)
MDGHIEAEQHERMLMGVCAELASRIDVSPSLIRANFVLSGLLLAPVVVAAYVVTGLVMGRRRVAC